MINIREEYADIIYIAGRSLQVGTKVPLVAAAMLASSSRNAATHTREPDRAYIYISNLRHRSPAIGYGTKRKGGYLPVLSAWAMNIKVRLLPGSFG